LQLNTKLYMGIHFCWINLYKSEVSRYIFPYEFVSGPKFNHTKRDTKSVRCPRKNREKRRRKIEVGIPTCPRGESNPHLPPH
jgi:hypothetical protein